MSEATDKPAISGFIAPTGVQLTPEQIETLTAVRWPAFTERTKDGTEDRPADSYLNFEGKLRRPMLLKDAGACRDARSGEPILFFELNGDTLWPLLPAPAKGTNFAEEAYGKETSSRASSAKQAGRNEVQDLQKSLLKAASEGTTALKDFMAQFSDTELSSQEYFMPFVFQTAENADQKARAGNAKR
jgi:hypothetical protein